MKWLTGEERAHCYVLRIDLGNGTIFEREWTKDQELEISKTEHWRLAEALLAAQQSTPLPME